MNDQPCGSAPAEKRLHLFLLVSGIACLAWSGAFPNGRFNWLMEVLPAILGGALLVATYRRFPLSTLSYVLIWLFSLILMTGGHWTYAEVPLGDWMRQAFGFHRNHFDRIGHFFQGIVPAMCARELLLRRSPLREGKWLFTICVCIALAISAGYELFEWQYAVYFGGAQADAFLGSQGDIWDTQNDMFQALCGAIVSQLVLSRWQSRQIAQLTRRAHMHQTAVTV
jgi:putative membrane protein